jgi:subtilisin-like proprotein convertase family protein
MEMPAGAINLPAPAGHVKPGSPLAQGFGAEVEPNGTFGTATPLASNNVVVRANLFPNGDVDFYSFTAAAGDHVYAATMTSFSAGSSTDSQITLLNSDGTTVNEFDDDNGAFAGLSSSIAGAVIPAPGTYYLKINDFTAGTTSERPYELHVRVQSGAPTAEVEANDTPATANPLPVNGFVSGARNPAAATEQDWYSLALNAGDTVFLSLDLDPERDGVNWNGRLGVALFGDATNQILVIDDAGTGDVLPVPNKPSEALFMTVKTAGTYFAFVDSASAAVGGPTATYNLSVSVHPATNEGVNCTTYTSTDVPKTIGPGTGLVSSTITVPGNPRIADVDVDIVLDHTLMADIDAHLRSPAGNDNGIFTDIGAAAAGGQAQMDIVFDDEAGIPPAFTVLKGVQLKPELNYRLGWFDGENAGGVWTLDLRDDGANANGGTLTAWSLRICEAPPTPSCVVPGVSPITVFSNDFEAGAAGFTHSGTADEWELGLPATVATSTANPVAGFNTCNSGVNCWKTDLDNTYDVSSSQELLSPNISLVGVSAPITLSWAQRYQMESASFDHYFVDVREVGNPTNALRVFQWYDATMTNAPGNPVVNIGESAGWAVVSADITRFVNKNIEVVFHVDTDSTVNFAGVAIDDVTVRACGAPTAANGVVSGRITDPNGVPVDGVVVQLGGTQNRKFITDANGNYRFDDVETNGFYSVTPSMANYRFSPESRSFSLLGNATDAAFTATRDSIIGSNRIDRPEYFVRQHYLDFLGREPDESGFNFWSDQILSCGADAACGERRTINVSAAYFLSMEFQDTGGLVDKVYRASYGRRPTYVEFMPDTATVARNVIVGRADWAQQLEANKQAFIDGWVQRAAFQTAYGGLTNASYVDALLSHTGVDFSQGERDALVDGLNTSSLTRAGALRQIAEDGRFVAARRNEMFVMMEYFGYLRREPDASGYAFWLNKLNQFGGNFEQAEMVKAFIVSSEYRDRFRQ